MNNKKKIFFYELHILVALGQLGHSAVHELNLAHVCDVYGPVLYNQVPAEVRPQQNAKVHAAQDRVRLAHLIAHLIAHAGARPHRLVQRVHARVTRMLA